MCTAGLRSRPVVGPALCVVYVSRVIPEYPPFSAIAFIPSPSIDLSPSTSKMSWIWSSAPPSDELEAPITRPTEDINIDPYATSFPTESQSDDTFGTAFGEIDYGSSTAQTPSADAFDLYTPPPSTFDLSPAPSSAPSVNFGQMGHINPAIVSPRTIRSQGAVDYVFADDYKELRKKSGAEQLTFLAGGSYLTGAAVGGSKGFYDAMRASVGKTTKLRLNAVLNGVGKRGAGMANTFGVLALGFSLAESAIYAYTNDETSTNYALAGAIAGGIFKSTRGPRAAALWSAAGAATALGTIYASRQGYYGRGLQGVL